MTILTFKHKGLRSFFESGSKKGIPPKFEVKLRILLDRLDASIFPKDMNFPGSDFHQLKGNLKEYYSVHVNGNWTVIFRHEKGNAFDVDLIDYH